MIHAAPAPPAHAAVLDWDDAPGLAAALMARRAGYVPEWTPRERGAEAALVQIAAHLMQTVARRLDQAPGKNELAFLELLGIRLVPAQPARAPLVVRLSPEAADARMPAGTRVAAAPPPGGAGGQISYETERSTGLAAAALTDVVSLWPGRDQYLDHSPAATAGRPFTLFDPLGLENTPHALYLAHDRLLALAGQSAVTVTFELTTGSSDPLDVRWEYWDGAVWRPFKDMRPACSNDDAAQLDSTGGLRQSGAYRLEADCAQTAKATVDGIEAFWVRGRLEETLPPDPARILPEVGAVRLGTEIARAYAAIWGVAPALAPGSTKADGAPRTDSDLRVRVLDASGVPLEGVEVSAEGSHQTDADGVVELQVALDAPTGVAVRLAGFQQQETVTQASGAAPLDLTFSLSMPSLDAALADGVEVDVTKPFFPLGVQPQPGAAFYFTLDEAFAKPGARLRVYVQPAATAQDQLDSSGESVTAVDGDTPLEHTVSWEYWNGSAWRTLVNQQTSNATILDLRQRGVTELTVPADLEATTVGGQERRWMRVRLVSGGYGVIRKVTDQGGLELKFFVATPPCLADLRIGWAWQDGPHAPEHALAHNDFQYVDRTAQATWPGAPFQPFLPVSDLTPALYLGFDRGLPVDDLGLYLDVVEDAEGIERPTLVWEYSDGIAWRRLVVEDGTRDVRVPGIVSFIGPVDMGPLARFGTPRHWLRARLNEDGPPGAPALRAIHPNAVWVAQRQTVVDEPVGASDGRPNQVLTFRQVPVLPGQEVEVRELAGPRANVEWRILATDVLGSSPRVIPQLEAELAAEGDVGDIRRGPLLLRRDRLKRVSEAWVRWEERPSLLSSGPRDRHYALDRARGRLVLGDGGRGRIPPLGAAIAARLYRTGGGAAGNVAAGRIGQLLGPIGGVEAVFNAAPAEGGADAESVEQVARRGPYSLRHRGRAIGATDYETLACEASPAVAVARAMPARDARRLADPGWVTLVIIPRSAEPRPYPSFGLRQEVLAYVAERAPADLAAAGQIVVRGPDYLPVDVSATLVPRAASEAGAVERTALDAVATFLHPLLGGPDGAGWRPGQDIFRSDLAAVLGRVEGVDQSRELTLLRDGVDQGERLRVPADRIPVAGELRLGLVENV